MSKTNREVQFALGSFWFKHCQQHAKGLPVLSVDFSAFSVFSPVTFNVVGCTCAILWFSAFENWRPANSRRFTLCSFLPRLGTFSSELGRYFQVGNRLCCSDFTANQKRGIRESHCYGYTHTYFTLLERREFSFIRLYSFQHTRREWNSDGIENRCLAYTSVLLVIMKIWKSSYSKERRRYFRSLK